MESNTAAPEVQTDSQLHVPIQTSDEISKDYETPAPAGFTSFDALKSRIRRHYELCSDYYYSLWGEHIHHGYFLSASDTKEVAQVRLIDHLLETSKVPAGRTVLDVGCGIGGTARYLAKNHGCIVTGLTISGKQVEMAKKLTLVEAGIGDDQENPDGFVKLGNGRARYVELDAEKMGQYFVDDSNKTSFDCVWISEAMSHLPDKALFFQNASTLMNSGGKLVVADWFKAEDLTNTQMEADIQPIEGMSM
ncbi:MAG: hypothetical protein M1812_006763 [Candelaria pacifica]|nr:MAG: hypothetical protein M1812_006763 [Candelaria pacifica]